MGSEEHKRSSCKQTITTTKIYQSNKKLAFLISIILATIAYYSVSIINNRIYSNLYILSKGRHGLGAGDNAGELKTALKRKGDGRAAVAILRVIGINNSNNKTDGDADTNNNSDEVRYLVQMKSHDYPIEHFRGTVCLLGGNANKDDATPIDTLKRELNEELHSPDWVNAIINPSNVIDDSSSNANEIITQQEAGTIRYLGMTLHFQSADLLNKPSPYAFICALYEITITPDQLPPSVLNPRGANIQEGRVVLLTQDQLLQHSKYAWGYEYTMESYFGGSTKNKQVGTAVSEVDSANKEEIIWTPVN